MIAGGHPRACDQRGRDPQRGAAAVSAFIFMLVMLGFLALSMNTGILMDTRTELQTASDFAALAAVGSLDGTTDGIADARGVAIAYSAEHRAFGHAVGIVDASVVFGRWHLRAADCPRGECFEPLAVNDTNAPLINAVQVNNGRDNTVNPSVDLPFGAFVGRSTSQVRSGAVAIGPGVGHVECSMPLVLAECRIRDGAGGDLLCGADSPQFVFTDANADAVGYVNFESKVSPSGTWTADYMKDPNRMCSRPSVGKAVLHNGNDFAKVAAVLRGEDGGTCMIGPDLVHTVAVTSCDSGDPGGGPPGGGDDKDKGKGAGKDKGGGGSDDSSGGSDTSTRFNGERDIVGFVQVRIVAVTNNHGDVQGCGDDVPAVDATPEKNSMVFEILCEAPAGNAGGARFGPGPNRVRIVR